MKGVISMIRFKRMLCIVLSAMLCLSVITGGFHIKAETVSGTNLITDNFDIDEILKRPYDDGMPLGFSENLFALYSSGWGFDQPSIYRTGLSQGYSLPVTIEANGVPVPLSNATYYPSHIHSQFIDDAKTSENVAVFSTNLAKSATVDSSYTSVYDSLSQINDGIISFADAPRSRWSNYADPVRTQEEWIEFSFGAIKSVNKVNVYVFTDGGACQLPASIQVKFYDGSDWTGVSDPSGGSAPAAQKNEIDFDTVNTNKIRVYFTPQAGKSVAATEIEIISGGEYPKVSASYTSVRDHLDQINDGIISYTDSPRSRWSNYAEPLRSVDEYIEFDLGVLRELHQVKVFAASDGGAAALPKTIDVKYFNGTDWVSVNHSEGGTAPVQGENLLTFDNITAQKVRIYLTPQENKCISVTEIQIDALTGNENLKGLAIDGYKFITENDMAAVVIVAENKGSSPQTVKVSSESQFDTLETAKDNFIVGLKGKEFDESGNRISKSITLSPGEKQTFKLALAFSPSSTKNTENLNAFFHDDDWLVTQKKSFNAWFKDNIPYFECDDPELQQIYYYRWLTYRNNIRKTPENHYIITEFLPNVSWAGKYNSIAASAPMHIMEGRWLKNQNYLNDYEKFWFSPGVNPRQYSAALAAAYYSRYLVNGDKDFVTGFLDDLSSNYQNWVTGNFDPSISLFRQTADRDGMEYGIGGDGYRPTINSYLYGDAVAISDIATLAGNTAIANDYALKAAALKDTVQAKLWNSEDQFFEVIKTGQTATVGTRELLGYLPWYFNMPDEQYSIAWNQITDENGFYAPYGPATAEQRDPLFMKATGHDCLWDGPSWPFATSQTITAAANLLNNYNQDTIGKTDYLDMVKTYAKSQYKNGQPWIAEDLDPFTGEWIVNLDRSIHYNHSTYNDLIITGIAGIRPEDNDEIVIVNPLLPEGAWDYFALENVSYRGHLISVFYDKSGTRYHQGPGLTVYVDGIKAGVSENIDKITIPLNETAPVITLSSVKIDTEDGRDYTADTWSPKQLVYHAAAQAGSGIKTYQYKIGDGSWQTVEPNDDGTGTILVSGIEGSHTISIVAFSHSGLESAVITKDFKIDTVKPSLAISGPSGWQPKDFSVSVMNTSPNRSKVTSYYSTDRKGWTEFNGNLKFSQDMDVTYYLKAVSEAGIESDVIEKTIQINAAGFHTIDKAEALIQSEYASESWAVLTEKKSILSALLENPNSTEEEINAATAELETALAGLKKIPSDSSDPSSDNSFTTSPSDNSSAASSHESSSQITPQPESGQYTNPRTGQNDVLPVFILILVSLTLLLGSLLFHTPTPIVSMCIRIGRMSSHKKRDPKHNR